MAENHVINARYVTNGYFCTKPVYRYNYGQVLRFTDFTLPETFEVHFASCGSSTSIPQIGSNAEVTVPDELLTVPVPIKAWLYLHDDVTDGETVYTIEIPVKDRAEITNQEPTPVQQDTITQAIAALNAGVQRAEELEDEWEEIVEEVVPQMQADIDAKADKRDTVLETTLSRGREDETTVGLASFAFGIDVEASGNYSHAEGVTTTASGHASHAEGASTLASGESSHAEGVATVASGKESHAEGKWNVASGDYSHAEGGYNTDVNKNVASGTSSHAEGLGTTASGGRSHAEGAKTTASGNNSHAEGAWTIAASISQHAQGKYNIEDVNGVYADIVGNGTDANNRSNASALDWEGNLKLAGDVYINANPDSTGGEKLAKESDIPEVPVQDVQVNGTSVLQDGIANVPRGDGSTFGVMRIYADHGLSINSTNKRLQIQSATDEEVKTGGNIYKPITTIYQHQSAFYGLAKAAGDATQSQSSNPVGTYTSEAKAAIQLMLDVPSTADLATKQDALTFDNAPTENSTNPVTSGGVYAAISALNTMRIHICTAQEYDSQTGIPTIQNPDPQTIYLVPGGAESNLYVEWAYINNAWEKFGQADIDLSGYATKANTVLETTLSRGRKAGTTVGTGSFAFGNDVEARGQYAAALGHKTAATAPNSYSEGNQTIANGNASHAEGFKALANGAGSHAEGSNTIANATYSHVQGMYNVEDSCASWPEWTASTSYEIGDKVKVTATVDNETTVTGYICKTANSDAEFTVANWTKDTYMNFAEIIGNGTSSVRSNARTLSWEGDERLMGDVYVGCNPDSTGGTKLAKISDIPEYATNEETQSIIDEWEVVA